jgi:hypothetical protein
MTANIANSISGILRGWRPASRRRGNDLTVAPRDQLTADPADIGALGLGLLVLGLSAFVYLGTADRVLGAVAALPLSVLWTVSNVLAPALLVPVEQEIARVVAHATAGGEDYRSTVWRIGALTGAIVAVVLAACFMLRNLLTRELFPGHPQLLVAAGLIMVAFAAQHVSRVVFAGTVRFRPYAGQLLADGVLRCVLPLVVVAVHAPLLIGFAAVLVTAPAVSVLVTAPALRRIGAEARRATPTSVLDWRMIFAAIGMLIITQTASTVVIGGSAIAARVLARPAEYQLAADLIAALLLSRVPLLAFYAIAPALIPRITWIARLGDPAQIRKSVSGLVAIVMIVGAVATAAAFVLGASIARIVFGGEIHVTGVQEASAFAAIVTFVAATIYTQSLVALRAYRLGAVVWALACACYLSMLALSSGGLQHRVLQALLGATAVALGGGAAAMLKATRQRQGAPS